MLRATATFLCALAGAVAWSQEAEETVEVIVSVSEQKLLVLRDGMWTHRFPVSTSKFGLGDKPGSYKTPLGRLRVCEKIGAGLPPGSVMQHRNPTGEILPVNARGRDPIVTRIMWLEGLEPGNGNAKRRGIYIHGTVEESKIGKPVSYGCIRMKSRDVLDLFEAVPMGSLVTIQEGRLPRAKRWSPPAPVPAPSMPPIVAAKLPVREKEAVRQKEPVREPMVLAHRSSEPAKEKANSGMIVRRIAAPSREIEVIARPQESSARNVVIRSSGAADHESRSPGLGADAFKGSILFSDLPGSSSRRN